MTIRLIGMALLLASAACIISTLLLWLSIYQRAALSGLAVFTGGVGLGLLLSADTTRIFTLVVIFLLFACGLFGASSGKQQVDLDKYYQYKSRARAALERGDQHQAELNEYAALVIRQSLGRLKTFKGP